MLLPPERRRSLFDARVVRAYLAGSACGGVLTALVLWVLSGLTEPLTGGWPLVLFGAGSIFLWMCKHGPLTGVVQLPEARRQIPAEVFGANLVRGAYRFGFELATGVRTYLPSAAPYVLLLALVLARPPLGVALLAGFGFGAGRAAPLVARLFSARFGPSPWGRISLASTPATLVVLLGGMALV